VAETLVTLQDEGKIRYAGVSNFGPTDLARYPDGLFVSDQIAYSVAFRAVEYEIRDACTDRGISLIAYSSLLHGILTGKFNTADDVPAGRARTRHFSADREGPRHDEPGHEETLFALVDRIRSLAAESGLQPKDVAMHWVMAQPGVATVLAGCRTAEHAKANAATMDVSVSEEVINQLTGASESLKKAMGSNPDMWMTESRVGRM
jgi:aryl-alcohol dehydrogenase-like predicted oxidoreductase